MQVMYMSSVFVSMVKSWMHLLLIPPAVDHGLLASLSESGMKPSTSAVHGQSSITTSDSVVMGTSKHIPLTQ